MYKNQLQELAQRSCFNLPSYSCIREGPDHAPRFKAKVNFNGETFESPNFFSTLRQAEHASAEVALKTLSQRGPSRALAARVLDETGVYKNLLQETAHRAGLNLPVYTTVRSGPGGAPLFACTVELAGMSFKGEPAKTKKQAQKSAAMAAWFSLKNLSLQDSSESTSSDGGGKDEQEQITVARYLAKFKLPERRKPLKAPVKNDVIPYHVNRRSDHQNYTYFPLSPYQNWHHGMTLLTSPSAPPSISGPQFFPFVQSIFQSGIGPPYIFPGEREPLPLPFFYVAGDLVPSCTRGSRVRIEEIEENSQVEEEWRLNTNTNSRAQTDDFSWLPHGFLRNNHGGLVPPWRSSTTTPQSTMGPTRFPPETSQVNRNATSRTGRFYSRPSWSTVPSCSSRVPFARTMAPAVQIRSVVPVCSAPAQRGPPLGQEASSSNGSEASKGISAPCSEFSRLQM